MKFRKNIKYILALILSIVSISQVLILANADSRVSSLQTGIFNGYYVNFYSWMLDTPKTINSVSAYSITSCSSTSQEEAFNTKQTSTLNANKKNYPRAIILSNYTYKYNCHSYAWRSQNCETNEFWIGNPSQYIADGSYYEVTTPKVGDIICYYDDNGTKTNKNDDKIIHSGLVVQLVNNATPSGMDGKPESVVVVSKWGFSALYRHNGYDGPYVPISANANSSDDIIAEYVRYYRKTGHTHNHNKYQQLSSDFKDAYESFHKSICSCGQIIYEGHVAGTQIISFEEGGSPDYVPQQKCKYCGYVMIEGL